MDNISQYAESTVQNLPKWKPHTAKDDSEIA